MPTWFHGPETSEVRVVRISLFYGAQGREEARRIRFRIIKTQYSRHVYLREDHTTTTTTTHATSLLLLIRYLLARYRCLPRALAHTRKNTPTPAPTAHADNIVLDAAWVLACCLYRGDWLLLTHTVGRGKFHIQTLSPRPPCTNNDAGPWLSRLVKIRTCTGETGITGRVFEIEFSPQLGLHCRSCLCNLDFTFITSYLTHPPTVNEREDDLELCITCLD